MNFEANITIFTAQRVNLELVVADYDRIGSSDPIGKVLLGYNRKGLELKHWKEMIENPRRPIVHWHVLKDPEPGDEERSNIKTLLHLVVFEGKNIQLSFFLPFQDDEEKKREKKEKKKAANAAGEGDKATANGGGGDGSK